MVGGGEQPAPEERLPAPPPCPGPLQGTPRTCLYRPPSPNPKNAQYPCFVSGAFNLCAILDQLVPLTESPLCNVLVFCEQL